MTELPTNALVKPENIQISNGIAREELEIFISIQLKKIIEGSVQIFPTIFFSLEESNLEIRFDGYIPRRFFNEMNLPTGNQFLEQLDFDFNARGIAKFYSKFLSGLVSITIEPLLFTETLQVSISIKGQVILTQGIEVKNDQLYTFFKCSDFV